MPVGQDLIVMIAVSIMFLLLAISFVVFLLFFGVWFQAYMSGLSVSPFALLGMSLRRTNSRAVVRALIMAKQGGTAVSCAEMEQACLQGVELEKVTLALIEAKKKGIAVTFQELVDAELQDRLREKLKM